ncbi:restriction endonuclease subunit S [Aeromonas dhakensis]|uniref:restriction endonuclease subunit S n=1 Tax=Aeromonas dhakensis TaxID=196024 RepID=UPI00227C8BCE|nr:restriction endonuclease subunit S [Aeromonas dhakensis]WAF71325.1 restriction endonuclease subunit S [Aeromonas dhakensis]
MAIENMITDHLDLWTAAVRPKSSAGRGSNSNSNSKLELTGIKKLRELILELAVRGKLVPQDPNDEPASVLLERIAVEKARLVKEGKIKKPKALAEIGEEEKPFGLPEGWEWCRVENISMFITSGSRDWAKYYSDSGAKFVTMSNLSRESYSLRMDNMRYVNPPLDGEGSRTKLEENDLLISITGEVGNLALIPSGFGEAYINQHTCLVRFMPVLRNRYLPEFMKSPCAKFQFNAPQRGIKNSFRLGDVGELIVSLPPENEQQRIVSKVDELMALCDQLELCSESQLAAHQTLVETLLVTLTDSCDADELAQNWARLSTHFDILFTTEASIDALKQSILQLAVMGKLVPQDPSDEPASALLERIAAEKARLVKEKKIKKEKPLPAISENEKPFELPQGWEWCHLKDIITIMDAGWSPACPPESSPDIDTWGVLKTTAVQTLEYREYENKVLDQTKTPRPEYEVMVGDILITRAGPKNRVGISCLVEKTRPKLMISDKIIRFHLVEVGLSERFISLCLNAGATAVYIDDSKSGMAESQMNISQDKLKLAPIPLGPIKEQNHIMDRVDQLMTLCDQLKVCLQTSQQTQLALAESLVEGALA